MGTTIITPEDLKVFKTELLKAIKAMISHQEGTIKARWLKSSEVRKILSISPGTLQNLRINGTLPYTKIGGVIFYDYKDLQKTMEENRYHHKV